MTIHTRAVLIGIAAVLIFVVIARLLLPRRIRLILYGLLIGAAAIVAGYIQLNREFLPTSYKFEVVITGLNQPLLALSAPGDDQRFFVVEKPGTVQLLKDWELQERPLLDISDQVASSGSEQGLLSMAFDPDFQENGFFYLYYYSIKDVTVLSRYTVSDLDPDVALEDSETILLEVPQPQSFHNGGHLLFGPDGYLYLSIGVGGNSRPPDRSQDLSNLLGTIIRVDVTDLGSQPTYRIPDDNPFVGQPNARPEIWAYGLRNPWRFDFDPVTGELYIADVGRSSREEINYQPAGAGVGANYGWGYYEGTQLVEEEGLQVPPKEELVFPVVEYTHLSLGGCSVIGGYVYRGSALPQLAGHYLYTDFCSGFIWSLSMSESEQADVKRLLRVKDMQLSSFGQDNNGELYIMDIGGGVLQRLVSK
jgi:glucose/arabinose dehydrogenase